MKNLKPEKILLLVFSIFAVHYSLAAERCLWAAGPNTISYQGRLRESGQPVSGARSIQFKLFDASSAGTPVFDSDPQSIYVSSGIFSYQLGSNKAAGYPDFKDLNWATSGYWLEISVGGNAMSPREQINAVPYAFTASSAVNANGLNGSGNIQITGAGPHYILNGDVGVGTAAPQAALHISTGVPAGSYRLMITTGTGNTTGNAVTVDNTGNVNINGNLSVAGAGGGVVLSSTNVNGSYMKFSDGTMICRHIIAYPQSQGSVVWTYPAAFTATPVFSGTGFNTAAPSDIYVFGFSATSTSVNIFLRGAGWQGQNNQVHCIAIGSWK